MVIIKLQIGDFKNQKSPLFCDFVVVSKFVKLPDEHILRILLKYIVLSEVGY